MFRSILLIQVHGSRGSQSTAALFDSAVEYFCFAEAGAGFVIDADFEAGVAFRVGGTFWVGATFWAGNFTFAFGFTAASFFLACIVIWFWNAIW